MSDRATIVSLLKAVGDRPIAFHTVYAQIAGSVQAGLFLSQAFYWSLRTDDPDGWFYKETSEFQEETTLTRHEQDTARRNLKSIGVLEEKRAGDHAILHYRVNFESLASAIDGNRQRPLTETGSAHCRIPAAAIDGNRQSVADVSISAQITPQSARDVSPELLQLQEREIIAAERKASKEARKGKRPFQNQRVTSQPEPRRDYAAEREANKAARIAREDAEILANLQASSRAGRR